MKSINRRSFIKRAAVGAAAFSVATRPWAQVAGANSAIRVAVVGLNSRGQDHLKNFAKVPGVRVIGLCDVDRSILYREVSRFTARHQPVIISNDVRRLLDDKNIDAISIATPNHWHALMTVWACQAGKDVYVEKPVSHNVWEGRQAVEAARKFQRIVQTGTQSRSSEAIQRAIAFLRSGELGKIKWARGLCYKRRASIGRVSGPQPIPTTVDYDLWTGPAPLEPLMRARLHYDWHWRWATGNGDLGNQGIHEMDLGRWALGETGLSPKVMSVGGRFGYVDDGQTANTQIVMHEYEKAPLFFEVRGLPEKTGSEQMPEYRGARIGTVVECERGFVRMEDNHAAVCDTEGKEVQVWAESNDHVADHFKNFINAVRSREARGLHADILEGHISSALCHTGNISYRVGHQAIPDEIEEKLELDKPELEMYERMKSHLAANGITLANTPATVGPLLTMDVEKEQFVERKDANALLARSYRAPFVVPSMV